MLTRQKSNEGTEAKLYLVGTPIGNYEDATFRMVKTLNSVDVIYCEDTRITGQLLNHFEIKKPLRSYNAVTENDLTEDLIEQIKDGKNIAICSDAGMPSISDPGFLAARQAVENGIDCICIPGVSAGITALAASGITSRNFYFAGFLNSKESKRIQEIEMLQDRTETLIIYEAPHRIERTLNNLKTVLGDRQIVLARELTKKYEEYLRGTISEVLEVVDTLKGEMVIIVSGYVENTNEQILNDLPIKEHYKRYIDNGIDPKQALKLVAKDRKIAKSNVYQEIFGKNKDK